MRAGRSFALLGLVLAGCGSPAASGLGTTPTASPTGLQLGDGKVSAAPERGYVWSCQTTFNGQGAQGSGPWIHGGTWDPAQKIKVQGDVAWPGAHFDMTTSGTQRVLKTADLPVGEGSGVFPIAASDPAYKYDRNPNSLKDLGATITMDLDPATAAKPSCLGLGPVGVLTDGVFLFDALDALGRDAVPHEVLDRCDGHPAPGGVYHHHAIPSCILDKATAASTLVGYAYDEYGIYVERDSHGRLVTNADLDACHGRVSPVVWNGKTVSIYHYDATAEYPYVIGCYHGQPPTQ